MTDHQLSYCNVCTKKHFDPQNGIVCSLTGHKPDFTNTCPFFDPMAGADLSTVGKIKAFVPFPVSLGKRLANMLIDTIVYYILALVSATMLLFILAVFSPDFVETLIAENQYEGTPLWAYVYAFAVYLFYYTIMEMGLGRTVGKMVTGTRVVDADGKKPSLDIAFKRSIARLVPFEGFSFLGSQPRGWHDRWTETYVVEKNPATENIFDR